MVPVASVHCVKFATAAHAALKLLAGYRARRAGGHGRPLCRCWGWVVFLAIFRFVFPADRVDREWGVAVIALVNHFARGGLLKLYWVGMEVRDRDPSSRVFWFSGSNLTRLFCVWSPKMDVVEYKRWAKELYVEEPKQVVVKSVWGPCWTRHPPAHASE